MIGGMDGDGAEFGYDVVRMTLVNFDTFVA